MSDPTAPLEPHPVPVDGGEIACRTAGAADGRALLLIHGNVASGRWWHEQLAAPPAGWRLFAPDLPGYGASPPLADAPPGGITLTRLADALEALLDAFNVERAVVVGHSLGGAVAQALVARAPERVRGLLLLASPPPAGYPTPEARFPLLRRTVGRRKALAAALAPLFAGSPPAAFQALVDDALAMHPDAWEGGARALECDLRPALAPLRAAGRLPPTLVLHGAGDPLISERMARDTAAAFAGELLQWSDGGHAPQLEWPERFNARLAEFLEGLP